MNLRSLVASVLLILGVAGDAVAQGPVDRRPDKPTPRSGGRPTEMTARRGGGLDIDLRNLPRTPPTRREKPRRPKPQPSPVQLPGGPPAAATLVPPTRQAPAPAPAVSFSGLDFNNWGQGFPPDTVGDVGPNHYVQAVNTSIGIYDKTGTELAAFSFDTFMSQSDLGNLCETNNTGDPVVLYDSFEDRWVLSDLWNLWVTPLWRRLRRRGAQGEAPSA